MSDGVFSKVGCRRVRAERNFSMEGVVAFLRRIHPTATALNVQAETGVSASTVENWLRGVSAASAEHLGKLFAAYGPPFMAAAFPVSAEWLKEERANDRIDAALVALREAIDDLGSR